MPIKWYFQPFRWSLFTSDLHEAPTSKPDLFNFYLHDSRIRMKIIFSKITDSDEFSIGYCFVFRLDDIHNLSNLWFVSDWFSEFTLIEFKLFFQLGIVGRSRNKKIKSIFFIYHSEVSSTRDQGVFLSYHMTHMREFWNFGSNKN